MTTTPLGWAIAFTALGLSLVLKLLYLHYRDKKKTKNQPFLDRIAETNDKDGLLDLYNESPQDLKEIIKRKLNRITNVS